MASPQVEDGFVQIALDLFVALETHDLPNDQRIVLTEVLLHSYGPRKTRTVHLCATDIEHYTNLHRNNARSAIKGLVASRVLLVEEDGSHRFNKDWETWTVKKKTLAERLGGGLVKFAKSALSRFARRKTSKNAPIQPDCENKPNAIQLDSVTTVKGNPTGLGSGGQTQSNWIGPDVYASGGGGEEAHERARASEDSEIGDLETLTPPPQSAGAREGEVELIEFAKSLGCAPDGITYLQFVKAQLPIQPTEPWWLMGLLERKVVGNPIPANVTLLVSIMVRYRKQGRPDFPPPPAPGSKPTLATSSYPQRMTVSEQRSEKAKRTADKLRARFQADEQENASA